MNRLSLLIILFIGILQLHSQSPHGAELQVDCASCHSPESWAISMDTFHFNHDVTDFALEGTHLIVDCRSCHQSLIFEQAPSQCASCHSDIHATSVGNDCTRCHSTDNWIVDIIPTIHEENGFPLVGSHGTLSCVECHTSETNLRFDRIGNECINCHAESFNLTSQPNHISVGFSNNCIECHDPLSIGWETDIVNHDFFPLTLGHDIQDCTQCHLTSNYSNISPECISCHQADFQEATLPPHESNNFPTLCTDCHTTMPGWTPASFEIHEQIYPLNGAHAIIENNCVQCHADGYANTPNTCVGCHLTEYNATMNPDHNSAGFPNDCAQCHSESAWMPASFDHDGTYFPIYSGKHQAEWNNCTDCHLNTASFSSFSCVNCHEHNNQSEVDKDHDDVSGYQYQSNACFACHPNGEE